MPHSAFPGTPPTPRAHRGFRIAVGVIALLALTLLTLQYTPRALLPAAKTDSLWGVLVGVVGMSVFVEIRWAAARRERSR